MIHRCFVSKNVHLEIKAFKAYVRPILEYCSNIWSPYLISDIQNIENVQRRFTKRIMWNLTYENRLSKLNLESLELRRLYSDACMAFQIIMNHYLFLKIFIWFHLHHQHDHHRKNYFMFLFLKQKAENMIFLFDHLKFIILYLKKSKCCLFTNLRKLCEH